MPITFFPGQTRLEFGTGLGRSSQADRQRASRTARTEAHRSICGIDQHTCKEHKAAKLRGVSPSAPIGAAKSFCSWFEFDAESATDDKLTTLADYLVNDVRCWLIARQSAAIGGSIAAGKDQASNLVL